MAFVKIPDDADPSPEALRRDGLRAAVHAEFDLQRGLDGGVARARKAIRHLVDAFLQNRRANARLFVRAHQIGRLLSETEGCLWTPGPDQYVLECPIYALHRGVAHSLALTQTSICSICGKGDFECSHVPGRMYDGEQCWSVVESINHVGHVALTANPDFLDTWHQPQRVSTNTLLERGVIESAGQAAYCRHCQSCAGNPTKDDLDLENRFGRFVIGG